jgi:SNF2 family DNA or RNA helicase
VPLPVATSLSREARARAANRVRALHDIEPWPELRYFNSAPCPRHAELDILCKRCGIRLRRHQRLGASWLYLGPPGMLSDTMGSGKSAQVMAMLAMCKENGELGLHNRAVIVCKAAALHNAWGSEMRRLIPGISVYVADGTKEQRIRGYMGNWEVVVISDRTFCGAHGAKTSRAGDVDLLEGFPVGILVYDDIDPLRTHTTETSRAIRHMADSCTRVVGLHATPVQKRLTELWCMLQPVGGRDALGSLARVKSRYVTQRKKWILTRDPKDKTGRTTMRKPVFVDNGITSDPRLIAEFRAAVRPLVLRRTAKDLDGDVQMPAVQPDVVFLELSSRQRARYEELRTGVLRRLKSGSSTVTQAEAGVAFLRARQICSGLAALDEGAGADDSAKMDKVMDALTGDVSGEKAVVFIDFKPNVAAMAERLRNEEVGHVLIWGAESNPRLRRQRLEQFQEDPDCRVLVGTTAIEASLNLQVARRLFAIDTIPNAQRMAQLVGRVARVGSAYSTVYFHHLLAVNTIDEGLLMLLQREAAMADVVWDEKAGIFSAITPRQLMRMVATGRIAA